MTARLTYINFGQIPATAAGTTPTAITSISPDNNYVNFAPDEDDDARKLKSDEYDSSDTVLKTSSKLQTSSGFLSGKKDKVRYNSLKVHKNDDSASVTSSTTSTGNHVLVIPSKLSAKVKVKLGKKDKSGGAGSNGTSDPDRGGSGQQPAKVSKKMGFSNMSFEDFPSDDALEESAGATTTTAASAAMKVGGKLMKIAPFEVIRNEKMLLEAEKKFGSLKRRSNPFS